MKGLLTGCEPLRTWRRAVIAALLAAAAHGPASAATLTVNTVLDEYDIVSNGTCSLREAVESANLDADFGGCAANGGYGDDTIVLPAGTYSLTLAPSEAFLDFDNSAGDLDVGGVLEILGGGALQTVIVRDSAAAFGVFQTDLSSLLRLVDLTVAGGLEVAGAGIFADGSLILERVVVRNNEARAPDAGGGGIVAFEALTLIDTLVTDNQVFLEDPCDIGPETTGGGIIAFNFGDIFILRSTIAANAVTGDEGCVGFGGGIGILAGFANVQIVNSTVSGNAAPFVGGVDILADAFFLGELVQSSSGGLLRRGRGGHGKTAWTEHRSQPQPSVQGRGIFNILTALEHVTIADNTAEEIGGLSLLGPEDEPFEIVIENSLIGANSADDAPDCSNFGFNVTSQGVNLQSIDDPLTDEEACLTSPPDLVGTLAAPTDPLLGPLMDNGGETPTQALLSGSPARDAAPDQGETEDQRGVMRPQQAAFDIGAFEAIPSAVLALSKTDSVDPVTPGDDLTYLVTAENVGPDEAQNLVITDMLPSQLTFQSAMASPGGVCATPSPGDFGGTVTCTFAGATAVGVERSVTIVMNVPLDLLDNGALLENEASADSQTTESPSTASESTVVGDLTTLDIPALGPLGLLLLALTLALAGFKLLRRAS